MMNAEITNGESTEAFVLSDVADLLQGRGDDRILARILNQPTWVSVGNDDRDMQDDFRDLMRAWGGFGKPDAQVYVSVNESDRYDEIRPVWQIRLDEGSYITFRMTSQGGREYPVAIWYYWVDDVEPVLPLYREDLDCTLEGNVERAKYTKSWMYRELYNVPMYDDEGFLTLGDEESATAEELISQGVYEVEPSRRKGDGKTRVVIAKREVTLAYAEFGSAEAVGAFRDSLDPLRFRSASEKAREARRFAPAGQPVTQRPPRMIPSARPPKAQVRQASAAPAVEPKRGLLARLLGR